MSCSKREKLRKEYDEDKTVLEIECVRQSRRETMIVAGGALMMIAGVIAVLLNVFGNGFGATGGANGDDDTPAKRFLEDDYSSDGDAGFNDDDDTIGEDLGPFRTTRVRLIVGVLAFIFGAIIIFMAKNYQMSVRITTKFVGISMFNGTTEVYEKHRIKTFRPATQAELGEGICGNDDKMCDGKTIVTDAAPEGGMCSWPSGATQNHLMMETTDGETWCYSSDAPCPWRTFTPADLSGKAQEVCDRMNAALLATAPSTTEVGNELVSAGVDSAAL
jgi:hypothetical protein